MSKQTAQYSVSEALDLLTAIAEIELDIEPELHLTHQQMVAEGKPLLAKSVEWIDDPDASASIDKIRSLFDVLYNYLSNRLLEGEREGKRQETIESIKQMMVIAGEAAKKLDKFTDIFDHYSLKSASRLPEYRKLQQFYHRKIDQRVGEGMLAEWILAISRSMSETEHPQNTAHVFIDLETVIKDTGYELLLIRKEDGSRFFNPKLLRNIKLVCDFGGAIGAKRNEDLFFDVGIWQDRTFQTAAENILKAAQSQVRFFYKQLFRHKDHEWVAEISQALMALMLASHSEHLLENHAVKTSSEYFNDFQIFLRRALHCREYQKLLVYPPHSTNVVACGLLQITQTLCSCLYTSLHGLQQMYHEIEDVLTRLHKESGAKKNRPRASAVLGRDYQYMQKALKGHANAALARMIDWIEEGYHLDFDPLMQSNLPNHFFDVYVGSNKIANLRIPCPVKQEVIDHVSLCEEYRAFLYACKESHTKHLHFNLQDRTAWKEHARSEWIEKLGSIEEFQGVLDVVTLATETPFYHQRAEYAEINDAHCFIEQFIEHLKSESSGYHFPERILQEMEEFCSQACVLVHEIFYESRPVLDADERRDFISLMHLFIQFKCIDLVECQTYSMSCKDAVDLGPATSVLQFFFWKLSSQKVLSDADCEYLNFMIYASALLVRERAMLPAVFERMVSVIRRLEEACEKQGYEQLRSQIQTKLSPLYRTPILNGVISFPKV